MSYYARSTGAYDLYEKYHFLDVHRNFLKWTNAVQGKVVLDVGFGSGRDSAYLSELGYQVVSVDASRDAVDFAKNRHSKSNALWIHDALPHLPKIRNTAYCFDIVICSAVIMDLSERDVKIMASRISILVRKNGILYITLKSRGLTEFPSRYSRRITNIFMSSGFRMNRIELSQDLFERQNTQWERIYFSKP